MESFHEGCLPERKSTFVCANENVVVTAIKRAEDGDGTVVRFYEIEGEEGSVSIDIFDDQVETSVAHHEIKTMQTDGRELDLIEWDVV